jgi:multiple sugar transport system permease protein
MNAARTDAAAAKEEGTQDARKSRFDWLEREGPLGYALTAPTVIILLLLIAYPFVLALWLSMTNKLVGQPGTFVGLKNFIFLLDDQVFRQTAGNTLIYTGAAVFFKVVLGVALALVLKQNFRGNFLVRGLLLLPWIVPASLSTLAWLWVFDSLHGVLNWALVGLNIVKVPVNWLGDPTLAKIATIVVNIWRGTPFFGIAFLAGLQSISEELFDAAKVDGANAWHSFWKVTLPLLQPVLVVVTIFSIVQTLADFQIVYVLTRGGPVNATHLFGTLAFQTAFQTGRMGLGAAISLFVFPALAILVIFELRRLREAI